MRSFVDPMAREAPDLRRKILDASVALVAREGPRAVSFREVARRLGISHQAPYHHFKNHLGILRAIAREGFRELAEAMRSASAAGRDPHDALRRAGIAYVRFAREHVGHFRVMFQRTLVDLHDEAEPIPEAEETHATLVDLAGRAHAAGSGHGLPVEAVTLIAWSTVHGIALLVTERIVRKGRARGAPSDEEIVAIVVNGLSALLAPEPAPARKARR